MATPNVTPTSPTSAIPTIPDLTPVPLGGFWADYAKAMDDYAKDYISLSITSVAVVAGTGPAINVGEVAKFKVRANNRGHLNLTELKIHIQGQNGALVSDDAAGPWSSGIITRGRPVDAHDDANGAYYYFKAPSGASTGSVALVRAHISSYDANTNHLMEDHSTHSDPPSGTYSDEVFPA